MKGQSSVARYRAIDLALFAAMLFIFEGIIVKASNTWFPQEPYTVSVVPAIAAIVMMRWGPWGGLHAALGGFVFCLFSRATPQQYLIYCLGNLFCLGALGLFKVLDPEEIRQDALKTWLFGLLSALLMDAGRCLVSLGLGAALSLALGFFTTDVVTLLFTLVILWVARRLDGVFENQNHYLLRLRQEQEEERGGIR